MIPMIFMSVFFLYGFGIEWFDASVQWLENAFAFTLPVVSNKLYYRSEERRVGKECSETW